MQRCSVLGTVSLQRPRQGFGRKCRAEEVLAEMVMQFLPDSPLLAFRGLQKSAFEELLLGDVRRENKGFALIVAEMQEL